MLGGGFNRETQELFKLMSARHDKLESKLEETLTVILRVSEKTEKEIVNIDKKLDNSISEIKLENYSLKVNVEQLQKFKQQIELISDSLTDIKNVVKEHHSFIKEFKDNNILDIIKDNQDAVKDYLKDKQKAETRIEAVKTHNLTKLSEIALVALSIGFVVLAVQWFNAFGDYEFIIENKEQIETQEE